MFPGAGGVALILSSGPGGGLGTFAVFPGAGSVALILSSGPGGGFDVSVGSFFGPSFTTFESATVVHGDFSNFPSRALAHVMKPAGSAGATMANHLPAAPLPASLWTKSMAAVAPAGPAILMDTPWASTLAEATVQPAGISLSFSADLSNPPNFSPKAGVRISFGASTLAAGAFAGSPLGGGDPAGSF